MKYNPKVVIAYFAHCGIAQPVTEHRFHSERKWRFDFAWPDKLIALEVEGGAWSGGRHTRGAGFIADMEKYNSAACNGWRIIRVTPQQLLTQPTIATLRACLG